MDLRAALNTRLVGQDRVVPIEEFMLLQTAPTPPPPPPPDPSAVRDLVPGEIGTRTMDETPYSETNLKTLLARTGKGCQWLYDNLDKAPEENLGLLCELLEATQCMVIAHMASGVLSSRDAA